MMMDDSNYTESNQSIQQELQNPPAAGSLLATDAGPVKHKTKGWAKKNCCYLTQALLFFGAAIVNLLSVILFEEDFATYNIDLNVKNSTKCFLFRDCAGNGLFCNIVVGAESIAALITFGMFVMYMVWMIKGVKIVSRFRVIDLAVVFALALLSCAVGIILSLGIPQDTPVQCAKKKCPPTCIRDQFPANLASTALYVLFALAAFYFLIFVLGMIPIVLHLICCNKVGRATNDEATPILSDASRRSTLS